MLKRFLGACVAALFAASVHGAVLQNPTISASFFNPTIGQSVSLGFSLTEEATVTARVLDRDGVPVRTLAREKALSAGTHRLEWDGRDDAGALVPNEAWSFRFDISANGATEMYFPADQPAKMVPISGVTYDRRGALLRYTLPAASRVHLQAGVATTDPKTKVTTGPVLKTVVNREPRAAGVVLDQWNGRDESGTIVVSELPNFVVAVATTPLPESSVITVGSRGKSFIETVATRKGASLLTPRRAAAHVHHQGLTSLEDTMPRLDLSVSKNAQRITLQCDIAGPAAAGFTKQGGEVMLFVDGRLLRKQAARASSFAMSIDVDDLTPGPHVVAVNWVTPNGPTAANASRVVTGESAAR